MMALIPEAIASIKEEPGPDTRVSLQVDQIEGLMIKKIAQQELHAGR
jgi:hypothetical protein